MAQERRIKLDPKFYGVYKSATVHTHKFKLPNYVWYIAPLLLFILGAIYYVYSLYGKAPSVEPVPDPAPVSTPGQGTGTSPDLNAKPPATSPSGQEAPMTPEQYAASFQPRISDFPASAPRYDALTEPKSFPRLTCVSSYDPDLIEKLSDRGAPTGKHKDREYACQCYTQQMSRYTTSAEFCLDVVQNGYFDDTLPDKLASTQHVTNSDRQLPGSATRGVPAPGMPSQTTQQQPSIVTIGSGKPGHLW